MFGKKHDIINQLRKDILLMQGFKPATGEMDDKTGLGIISDAFPNSRFPTGAIHEFFCAGMEEVSASSAFISGIVSSLMKNSGIAVWIASSQLIYPPALKLFGIDPAKVIFLHLPEKKKLWAMEEALKCEGLSCVIGEVNEISFIESRRLQLATEQTKVTGFLIRRNPKNLSTTCVTRWKIQPIESNKASDLPGLGFPRWNVSLLKVRNGKPGSWQMEWRRRRFRLIQEHAVIQKSEERKVV